MPRDVVEVLAVLGFYATNVGWYFLSTFRDSLSSHQWSVGPKKRLKADSHIACRAHAVPLKV
jgi:hypothetical protein